MLSLETVGFGIVYVVVLSAVFGAISAAPWVPTKKGQRRRLLETLDVPKGATVYDLGCGDGTVLFELARQRPDLRLIGYEVFLLPFAIGVIRKLLGGRAYRKVSIRCGDLFRQRIGDADAVFVFLLEKSYGRLAEKLGREIKDDCVVVTEAWPIPQMVPARVIAGDAQILPMYYYEGKQFRG